MRVDEVEHPPSRFSVQDSVGVDLQRGGAVNTTSFALL
jgi:hypothetical protein